MKRLIYLLRNTPVTNFVFRNFIRVQLRIGNFFEKLATRFRISGIIKLQVEGIQINCLTKADDFMANGIYYKIDFEESEFRLIKILATRANYFVEVGAYTGIFSIFTAKVNPKINVLCVEPHPNNFKRIVKNIALNVLSNIRIMQLAAGDEARSIKFSIPKVETLSAVGSVNHVFSQAFHEAQYMDVMVAQQTLDQLLTDVKIGPLDLIKIDVEYYELNVLRGALRTLQLGKPLLMVEIILSERLFYYKPAMKGNINESHAMEVETLLKEFGYSPYHILKDGIYRTDSIINSPDARNYLFAPKATSQRFIPFNDVIRYFSVV